MDAASALDGLLDVSNQVRAAVIVGPDGAPAASTFEDEAVARRVAESAARLLGQADATRPEGAEPVTQVEAATRNGSVFVVREGGHAVVATTEPEPTIGLVMYDLRTCLRALEDPPAATRGRRKAERA